MGYQDEGGPPMKRSRGSYNNYNSASGANATDLSDGSGGNRWSEGRTNSWNGSSGRGRGGGRGGFNRSYGGDRWNRNSGGDRWNSGGYGRGGNRWNGNSRGGDWWNGNSEEYGQEEEEEAWNEEGEEEHEEKVDTSEEKKEVKASGGPSREEKTPGAKGYFKDSKRKAWRLIVRNLPFNTTKADLQNICSKIGPFTDIVVPPSKKMPGKCSGFAFIQFTGKPDAEKGKEFFNNNSVKGRSVAADWALDKDTYETANHDEKSKLKKKVKVEDEQVTKASKAKPSKKQEDDEEEDEDEDMSEDEDEKEEEDESADDEEESDSDDDDEEKEETPKKRKADSAIAEGRVVFVRNLSFDTTEETLKERMSEIGTVNLALICKFPDSGHSKGTGFVHFSTPDEATRCMEECKDCHINIDGRTVNGIIAVPREQASQLEKDKLTKVPKDNRNLRLLRFGLIRDGTSSANGMSKEDADKRRKLAEAARKKLENLHMFVSPVRLMIHNLPPTMTDAALMKLCRATVPEAYVNECRIWKDSQRLNAKGQPKSKGFAFVAFNEHKHALDCLQKLNNNPKTFTDVKRPIVEFSIENIGALQAKARRSASTKDEKVNVKEVNEKVKQQIHESIGEIHSAGMKFLPKFLGKKMRHRDMSKSKKKRLNVKTKTNDQVPKKKKNKKAALTKVLALSS